MKLFIGVGCFWGGQSYFDKIKGISNTKVGYLNGGETGVSYENVKESSGHVEVIEITYEEKEISDHELFDAFIRVVNPHSLNEQGGDKGIQYRIGIYYTNHQQARSFKSIVDTWAKDKGPHYIEVEEARDFTLAEEYHQNYLQKNPGGFCHINLYNIPSELSK